MLLEYLDLLRCPLSGAKLELRNETIDNDGHILSGDLIADSGSYKIINGIPRFILAQSATESKNVKSFGDQWHEADKSILTYGQHEDYFDKYLSPLKPEDFFDKIVIDAGCGNGRLVEFSLRYSPEIVIGIDYSDSVEIAFNRTRHLKNVIIIQASLQSLPIKLHFADIIYSLGVVHHLEQPEKGLSELGKRLASNGKMHIWTYSHEGNELYLVLMRPMKCIASMLNNKNLWRFSFILALLTWPYVVLCGFFKTLSFKFTLPLQDYMAFIRKLGFVVYKTVIHDQLVPEIAFYPTRSEIMSWIEKADLELFHLDMRTGNSWRAGMKRRIL